MASKGVTGKTEEGIRKLRDEFKGTNGKTFEETYCLAKIPNQPEDYDGPPRYCSIDRTKKHGSNHLCKYHGGAGSFDPDNTEKLAPMKHGMNATRKHLCEDFDDKDQVLYDWIVDDWPDAYGIDLEEDPGARYDLHRLAAEVVRAERGRGYLIEEGEIVEQERYAEDGSVVIDDSGEVVTEKSEHYLAQMMHRQDKKIKEIEKELGITRKERLRQESTDNAVEAIKSFAEVGSQFIDRDEKDYDHEEEPWKD